MKKMICTHRGYSLNRYLVTLEEHEMDWPDERIITACDRYGTCPDNEWAAIEAGQHPCHFGGSVERHEGGRCEVTVYTD